jgi:5'-nucleotidase
MRILVTNDDGIHAPGLAALEEIAAELSDDVWIVAPETDQSGVSHSVSLNDPLRLRQIEERRFAVRGTPTDCVLMGARHILRDAAPDLVLSGVNRGHNIGEDVIYSGTVAGAMEGTMLGIASIALSQAYSRAEPIERAFGCAITHGPGIVRKVIEAGIPHDRLVNINFPACEPEEVAGIEVTRQGKRRQEFARIDARVDGRANPYFWIVYGGASTETDEGTDVHAMTVRRISITPLQLDLTDGPYRERLADAFSRAFA